MAALGAEYAARGKKLVLTNGCFDLLHTGHASVRELKGPERPLNAEADRAEVLSALRCVDHVTIFTGKRVTDVIRALRPALYAKGGDYTPETLDPGERAALEEVGAEIRILQLVPGQSTTGILEKARVK